MVGHSKDRRLRTTCQVDLRQSRVVNLQQNVRIRHQSCCILFSMFMKLVGLLPSSSRHSCCTAMPPILTSALFNWIDCETNTSIDLPLHVLFVPKCCTTHTEVETPSVSWCYIRSQPSQNQTRSTTIPSESRERERASVAWSCKAVGKSSKGTAHVEAYHLAKITFWATCCLRCTDGNKNNT